MTTTAPSDTAPSFPMEREGRCPFDPPPSARRIQHDEPITRVSISNGTTPWLVTRYDDARKVLADSRVSSDPSKSGYPAQAGGAEGQGSPVSFILMDDPDHARLRRMVTAPFAVKRIEALRPRVQKVVDDLIDGLLSGPQPVDLVEAFALPVPSLVICELLGVPYADHDHFQENSSAIVRRTSTMDDRRAALGALSTYLTQLLEKKIEAPEEDLLSDLGARVVDGELTLDEASQMGVLLLIAGHETTANMIALGTLALLEHPGELATLQEAPEPSHVASAVEELLRYLTILHAGRRRVATADIEIGDVMIHEGDGVIVAADLGNRDEAVFEDPDRLDLTRNPRAHIAFGFGVHQCLGQPLARMELQVVYGTLFRRIPTLRRAVELDEIPFKTDGTVYGVYELPVAW